jgi:hypothetical protein
MIWGCGGNEEDDQTETTNPEASTVEQIADSTIDDEKELSTDAAANKFIVEPGVGMGDIHFGDSLDKARQIIGKPIYQQEKVLQYSGLGITARDGNVLMIACGDMNKPDSEHVKECPCKTTEGIGMDSSMQEVVQAYGEPARKRVNSVIPGAVTIAYPAKGMSIALHNDKVYFMTFEKPRQ